MRRIALLLSLITTLLLPACSTYTEKIREGLKAYAQGRMEEARSRFSDIMDGGLNDHLLRMERGMAYLALGEAQKAVEDFAAAADHMDRLGGGSTTRNVASYMVDDTVRDYPGAPFEQISTRIFRGTGYLMMEGRFEDVSASCRDLDIKMEQIEAFYERQYPYDGDGNASHFSFQIPPLGKYFAALAAERRGELDNAGIYMRQTVSSMPDSAYFRREAERMKMVRPEKRIFVFALLGMIPEKVPSVSKELTGILRGIKAVYGTVRHDSIGAGLGQALFTAPVKIPAYPPPQPFWHGGFKVTVADSGEERVTAGIADFEAYARKEFDTLHTGMLIRAAVRRLIKEAAGQGLGRGVSEDRETAALLGTLFSSLVASAETVDTRSWCTLPREIHAATFSVLPETRSITLEPLNQGGNPMGPSITVPLDLTRDDPAFVFVFHPGRNAQPLIVVDEGHRVRLEP